MEVNDQVKVHPTIAELWGDRYGTIIYIDKSGMHPMYTVKLFNQQVLTVRGEDIQPKWEQLW